MAVVYNFEDFYTSECENCGADLVDWDWLEDDMVFKTACTCGTEYILKPNTATMVIETGDLLDEEQLDEDE